MTGILQNGLKLLAFGDIYFPEEGCIRLIFLLKVGNHVNHLSTNSGVSIPGHSQQQAVSLFQLSFLKAYQMSCRCPDPIIGRAHQPLQEGLPHLPMIVQDPESLEDNLIALLLLQPRINDLHHSRGMPQLPPGMIPDQILGMFKERQKLPGGRPLKTWPVPDQWFSGVSDSPDPPGMRVPAGIPHRVLSMTDNPSAEVRDIHRSIKAEGDINRPEEVTGRRQKIEPVTRLIIGSIRPVL